jgi:hypothetical protein
MCIFRLLEQVFFGLFKEKNFQRRFPSIETETWGKQTDMILKAADTGPVDNRVDRAELFKLVSRGGRRPGVFFREATGMAGPYSTPEVRSKILQTRVLEIFGWHDTDGDDIITAEEIFQSVAQFHILHHRAERLNELEKRGSQTHFPHRWKVQDEKIYGSFRTVGVATPVRFEPPQASQEL